MRHLLVPLIVIVVAGCGGGAAPGPNRISCTLIGCSDGVAVDVVGASGPVPSGDYLITVDSAAGRREHRCTLPPGAAQLSCSTTPVVYFADGKLSVEVSGAAPSVTITVAVDGTTRAMATLTPQYTPFQPNGPQCDPICQRATATVTLQ